MHIYIGVCCANYYSVDADIKELHSKHFSHHAMLHYLDDFLLLQQTVVPSNIPATYLDMYVRDGFESGWGRIWWQCRWCIRPL